MRPPGFWISVIIVVCIVFLANNFIRMSGPVDAKSTGFIIDFMLSQSIMFSILVFIFAIMIVQAFFWIYGFIRGVRIPGVMDFWKLVAQNPDNAYEWFIQSEFWEVREHPLSAENKQDFPASIWAGPFDLYVPSIERRICIFGKEGQYENSREQFIQMITYMKAP